VRWQSFGRRFIDRVLKSPQDKSRQYSRPVGGACMNISIRLDRADALKSCLLEKIRRGRLSGQSILDRLEAHGLRTGAMAHNARRADAFVLNRKIDSDASQREIVMTIARFRERETA
jgi:hypothetical protein